MKERNDAVMVIVGSMDSETAIRKFSRKFKSSGISSELFDRRHFEKPSVRRRKKHTRALAARRSAEKRSI